MDIEIIKKWLENPSEELSEQTVEELLREYPFFSLPEADMLRQQVQNMSDSEREKIIERVVLSLSDTQAAQHLIDQENSRFDNFYPEKKEDKTPDTDTAISRFLDNYGKEDKEEISVLEKLIFNPVADYSQQLARQEKDNLPVDAQTGDERTDRINRFILSYHEGAGDEESSRLDDEIPGADPTGKTSIPANPISASPHKTVSPPTPPENSTLSESLAKIYIKTGRYERAYEILNRLSLAVPEKNAYFADQMRFLRKLIVAKKLLSQRAGKE